MRPSPFKWLAVLPALAVFALLVGALRAGGTPAPQSAPAAPFNARDAWDIPAGTYGELPADMVALTSLPERTPPLTEAEFNLKAETRSQMPATKAPVAFLSESYDAYLSSMARRNRLRITRFWYSRGTAAPLAAELSVMLRSTVTTCADHTWSFGREHTVSFELSPEVIPANVTTDGSPALTECFGKELLAWKGLGTANRKAKPGTKVTASFVVMKN